jgi:hypothetical protein
MLTHPLNHDTKVMLPGALNVKRCIRLRFPMSGHDMMQCRQTFCTSPACTSSFVFAGTNMPRTCSHHLFNTLWNVQAAKQHNHTAWH